jgi:hypothetical protein
MLLEDLVELGRRPVIFSKDLLFIHVPKTGGMSVTRYLLQVLPRPVYYAHQTVDERITDTGIVQMPGRRHETLEQAAQVVGEYGFNLSDFRLIISALRNPYSLEVSRYAYLQTGKAVDRGYNQKLALTEDFENFAIKSFGHTGSQDDIEKYFVIDSKVPKNLRIVFYENLVRDIRDALRIVGIEEEPDFPWVNRSHHGDFLSYYTRLAEEAVYQRYRWVFDNGFYDRIDPEELSERLPANTHRLPVVGPVRQVGPSSGFWSDLWVGENARLVVRVDEPIHRLVIEGRLPSALDGSVWLSCSLNGRRVATSRPRGERFEWAIPCELGRGATAEIEIGASSTWSPSTTRASPDKRQLSFRVNGLVFLRLKEAIRGVVGRLLPVEASVAVVSKGDEELLRLNGLMALHFPQTEDGRYSGGHPADSVEAICHLEALREKGVEFLLIPTTAFWWLDHYAEFHRHLDAQYVRVWVDDSCIIYHLSDPESGGAAP